MSIKAVRPWHEMSPEEKLESKISALEALPIGSSPRFRLIEEVETLKRIIRSNQIK